jgi:hypothetical protein
LEEAACVYRLKRNTLKHSGINRLISDNYINYSTCFLFQYFSIYRFQSVDSDLLSSNLNENGDINLNWVYFIRTILNECGFTYIWETENVNNKEWLKCVMKQRLLDQFVQNWQTSLSDSSKALNYRIFKTKFEFEEYFNID